MFGNRTFLSALAVLAMALGSRSAGAQTLADCPNQQVGSIPALGKVSVFYSQCSSKESPTSGDYHWALVINSGTGDVELTRQLAAEFVPAPASSTPIGVLSPLKYGLRNVGNGYTGNCSEVTATATSAAQADLDTYCGWAESASGQKILLKTTLTKGSFTDSSIKTTDTDGDGEPDGSDTDDDGDGVADVEDDFPLDSSESEDLDGDGVGNNADADDDGDGVADVEDDFPLDSSESEDLDGDGVGNNADTDDDGDGVPDVDDASPGDPAESEDSDGDGVGDNADTDDDGDGVSDIEDDFPLDPTESEDSDGDGVGNNADADDDGDGVSDVEDEFPLDPNESEDSDGDGIGNNADPTPYPPIPVMSLWALLMTVGGLVAIALRAARRRGSV